MKLLLIASLLVLVGAGCSKIRVVMDCNNYKCGEEELRVTQAHLKCLEEYTFSKNPIFPVGCEAYFDRMAEWYTSSTNK